MDDRKIEWSFGCCSATTSCQFHKNVYFTWKKRDLSLPYIKLSYFLTQELCQYSKSGGMFSSSKPVMASSHCSLLGMASRDCSLLGNWSQKHSVFVLACPTLPSCAWALPQELGPWFCSQNLWFSSGKAFWSDCQMTGRGSNLDSTWNLNSCTWPRDCRGFFQVCSETPEWSVSSLNSFRSIKNTEISTLIHQTAAGYLAIIPEGCFKIEK